MLCGGSFNSKRERLTGFRIDLNSHKKNSTQKTLALSARKTDDAPIIMTAHDHTKINVKQKHPLLIIPRLTEHDVALNFRGCLYHFALRVVVAEVEER